MNLTVRAAGRELNAVGLEEGRAPWKIAYGHDIPGKCAETQTALNIPDAYKENQFDRIQDVKRNYRTHSILCVPFMRSEDGEVIGVVYATNKVTRPLLVIRPPPPGVAG